MSKPANSTDLTLIVAATIAAIEEHGFACTLQEAILHVAAKRDVTLTEAQLINVACRIVPAWENRQDDRVPCPVCNNVTYAGETCRHPAGSL